MPSTSANPIRLFISYRSQDPDLSLAQRFYDALEAAGYESFMAGESIRLGENWAQRVDEELERADYFLLLLSPKSATSEMVTEEVRRAKELRDRHPNHKPVILPIRVNFPWDSPLNYDLRGYLNRIQQREWKTEADTPKILQEILTLLAAGSPLPPLPVLTDSELNRLFLSPSWQQVLHSPRFPNLTKPISLSLHPFHPPTLPLFPSPNLNFRAGRLISPQCFM